MISTLIQGDWYSTEIILICVQVLKIDQHPRLRVRGKFPQLPALD